MTVKEIESFLEKNDSNVVRAYFESLVQKKKDLTSSNNWISFLMILTVFVYFFIDSAQISEVNFGLISITNAQTIKLFSPLVFSLLLFIFATLSAHRAEVLKAIKIIGGHLYKLGNGYEASHLNDFLRLITPFSFWDEVNSKFMENGKVGCLTLFLTLPLYPMIVAPFVFEYHIFKIHYLEVWSKGLVEKGLVILNAWLVVAVIIYYFKLLSRSWKTVKDDRRSDTA